MHRLTRIARRAAPLAAVALLLAACSDQPTAPSSSGIAPTPLASRLPGELNDTRHVMHVKAFHANDAAPDFAGGSNRAGTTSALTQAGISYHGGRVITSGAKVAAFYWANSVIYRNGPAVNTYGGAQYDGSLVGYFLGHLGGSPYFNINTTYTNGSGTPVPNALTYTQFIATNYNAPAAGASVSDAQMVSLLQWAFSNGYLTYDANTVYAIFTAGTVNLGGGFGTQYCAYHTHGAVTVNGVSRTVLYAAMPYDYAHASACTSGYAAANGDPGADYEVNTLGHEIEEAVTDPLGSAWYDSQGYENADKCAWTWGSTASNGTGTYNMTIGAKQFLVQRNWVNAGSGGCAKSY